MNHRQHLFLRHTGYRLPRSTRDRSLQLCISSHMRPLERRFRALVLLLVVLFRIQVCLLFKSLFLSIRFLPGLLELTVRTHSMILRRFAQAQP
jgi:hypothetical protein